MKTFNTYTIKLWERKNLLNNPSATGFAYQIYETSSLIADGGVGGANDPPYKTSQRALARALAEMESRL